MEPMFKTNYLGFWIKVYQNRVEFNSPHGHQSIPINQIAGVQLGIMGYMGIVIETTGGKKHKIPCIKKREVRDAIYNAQMMPIQTTNSNTSLAGELEKLASLKEKGIITQKEFDEQKTKLLSQ